MGLDISSCTCHVGFHSNEQIIGNLLHMVVQLALFPKPFMQDIGIQEGSFRADEAAVQTEVLSASIETQTLTANRGVAVQAGQAVRWAESQTDKVTVGEGAVQTNPPITVDTEAQCQQHWVGQWEWTPEPLPPPPLDIASAVSWTESEVPRHRARSVPPTPTHTVRIGGGFQVLHDGLAETRKLTSPGRGYKYSTSISTEQSGFGRFREGGAVLPFSDEQLPQPWNDTMPDVMADGRHYRVLRTRPEPPNIARTPNRPTFRSFPRGSRGW